MPAWFVMTILFLAGGICGFMIAALMAAASYGDDLSRQVNDE